jgi:hypothetical protein
MLQAATFVRRFSPFIYKITRKAADNGAREQSILREIELCLQTEFCCKQDFFLFAKKI